MYMLDWRTDDPEAGRLETSRARRRGPCRRRSGTSTITGPLETTSEITSPFWPVPESGLCETTRPLGTVSSFTSVVSTLNPRFSRAACAGSAGLPVKSGILIGRRSLADHDVDGSVAAQRCADDRVGGDHASLGDLLVEALHGVAVLELRLVECLLGVVEGLVAYVGNLVPLGAERDDRADGAVLEHAVTGVGVGGDDEALADGLGVGLVVDLEVKPGLVELHPGRGLGEVEDAGSGGVAGDAEVPARQRLPARPAGVRRPASPCRGGSDVVREEA